MSVFLLGLDSLFLIGALLALRIVIARDIRKTLLAYQLRFPRGLEVEGAEAFLAGLSGLLQPWWKRWLYTPYAALEVHASQAGIHHYLLIPEKWAPAVENLLQAAVPSVRYEEVGLPFATLSVGAEFRLTDNRRALRVDAASLSAKLLASLQPLSSDVTVIVQLMLTPHGPVPPIKVASNATRPAVWESQSGLAPDSEIASAMRAKYDKPLLLASPRIGVASEDVESARQVLRRVEVIWHETRAPGVHLQRRSIPSAVTARRMIERRPPLIEWPATLNSQELAGMIGWPIESVSVPGLALGGSRLVAASPLIPTTGTILADSNFPGDAKPLALGVEARLRHTHVLGPTGTGKSFLLASMVIQDLKAGRGLVLFDPKGDLVQTVLEHVPPERRDDVIVLDPADSDLPVGLNPLQSVDRDHAEVVVENLVGLFKSLYRSSWGPRLDDVLRAALLTLAGAPGTTLCEVALILTDPTYRRRIVGRLDDPIGLESFWGWWESISEDQRQIAASPVLNKVRAFTMRPRVRSIIGQSQPSLNFRDALANRKVVLVSLATGLLGDEAASLLGALVVAELWHATLARADQHSANRVPVMAYLDEWQHFLHLPTPMAAVLAEARGLGLGMVLAHQNLDQLPEESQHAVLANARSRVVFQLPSGDARIIARELGGVMTADDLQGLGAYEVAVQLFAGGSTQPVATGKTRPLGEISSSPDDIRELSRSRYGVSRDEVEREIRDRQHSRPDAPTGRRRRHGGNSTTAQRTSPVGSSDPRRIPYSAQVRDPNSPTTLVEKKKQPEATDE